MDEKDKGLLSENRMGTGTGSGGDEIRHKHPTMVVKAFEAKKKCVL